MFKIILDTETTGLGPRVNRPDAIVEIGAVCIRDGHIQDVFHSLCRPDEKYYADGRAHEAFKVNGITIAELEKAPSDETVAMKFRLWLARFAPVEVFIYNSSFDMPFLAQAPWCVEENEDLKFGPCVMKYVAQYLGEQGMNTYMDWKDEWKWLKLVDAADKLKVKVDNKRTHNALYDAYLAVEVGLRSGVFE